jgi:hypothetical protein
MGTAFEFENQGCVVFAPKARLLHAMLVAGYGLGFRLPVDGRGGVVGGGADGI